MLWKKNLALFVTGFLMIVVFLVGVLPATAQSGPNLLVNPGFEEGHYNQGGIAEITVPNGWRMHWVDGVSFSDAYNGLPAHRPETVVWNSRGGIPAGEEVLWRDGIYTLKIFKSWAPMYAALSQDVTGLQVGRRYQLVAPVFTDVYDWDGRKVYPTDPTHGQVRLGASPVGANWRDEAAIAYSGWFAGSYGQYGIFAYEFTATQADMTVWIEVKANYPHGNNGFFIDTVALYALNATAPVSGGSGGGTTSGGGSAAAAAPVLLPLATPRADGSVVHVVQAGDSLWTIAIRYADMMQLAPADALAKVQALNNNPAFLTIGQEILVIEPGVMMPTPEPAAETAAEDAAAEGEATTETETAVDQTAPTPEPAAAPQSEGATLCVAAFVDANGDGVFNQGVDSLLADAALSIARANQTVVTTVTDGIQAEQCFTGLEPDTYQVRFYPPANFRTSTADNWAVALAAGMRVSVSFGAQEGAPVQEVAAMSAGAAAGETAVAADTTHAANAAPEAAGPNFGLFIIGGAVLLVLLAGIGITLLRRA